MNVALATTWEERLADLGNVPASRIRCVPAPGTATMEDVIRLSESEVLSVSNTHSEMSRKRREYFYTGVELLWMVDHRSRTITVFRSPQEALVVPEGQTLDGGKVLPGWHVDVAELLSRLERSADTQ